MTDETNSPNIDTDDIRDLDLDERLGDRADDRPETAQREISRGVAGVSGVLAAGLALGVGELLSGLSSRIPSLVTRVGDVVIDNVPGSVERWAIDTLGTNDKPALIIGITVISLLLGMWTGIAASKRFAIAWAVFGAFAIVGALAAASDPQRSAFAGWFVALAAGLAGVASLRFLFGAARSSALDLPRDDASPFESDEPVGMSGRRTFVSAATAAAAVGVAAPVLGSALRSRQTGAVEDDRENVAAALDELTVSDTSVPPTPTADPVESATAPTAEPLDPAEMVDRPSTIDIGANFDDVPGITPVVVPNDEFYRIDTALQVPTIDVDSWSMRITGMVDTELEFTFDDLLAMDPVEEFVTLSCVSNEVGGDLVGNARWLGVPITKLLEMAGVQPGATQIVGRSVDGWTGGFPTAYLDDPDRVALVAVAMNGEPLPIQHGFPVRLVVAGLYGYVSATKWLKEIELTTLEDFDGYWITRGWSKLGPIKTQSRIDVPRGNSLVDAGEHVLAGVAWAPDRGVDAVEIGIARVVDNQETPGVWVEAELSEDVTDTSWRQWRRPWTFEPGDWLISVRATDGEGQTQTAVRAPVAPDGATGWHRIVIRVV